MLDGGDGFTPANPATPTPRQPHQIFAHPGEQQPLYNALSWTFVEPEKGIELLTCSLREIAQASKHVRRRLFAQISALHRRWWTAVDDYWMRPKCALVR